MTIFDAVVQGVVQGLTEFLPVSSSGHLLISQHILGVHEDNLFFNVMLHLGTLAAVLAVYYKTIIKLIVAFFEIIKNIFTGKFKFKELSDDQNMVFMIIIGLMPLFLFFLPVPGSGTNIKDVAEDLANDKNIILVGASLILTSVLLKAGISKTKSIGFRYARIREDGKRELWDGRKRLCVMDSVWIGVMQFVAAIFPGLSRSGSTMSVGLLRGLNRQTALDYSFILGIPAITAAAALELKDAVKVGAFSSVGIAPVLVGMAVSAIVGFLSIKLFKWLLKTDKMMIFVIYTFVVGLAAIVIGILEQYEGINIFTGVPL
jgi:undecaprenyl-diphosphatase